jgi:hypothetical protein
MLLRYHNTPSSDLHSMVRSEECLIGRDVSRYKTVVAKSICTYVINVGLHGVI